MAARLATPTIRSMLRGKYDMDIKRQIQLETTDAKLTADEISAGWHFCPDWDGMVVNKYRDKKAEGCTCKKWLASQSLVDKL